MDKRTRILVVDDDKHIAELISLYLNKEGYETKESYTGKHAVSDFSSFAPDLILLDIMLPLMDGYDVCREIRKTSSVPIIMLTAKGETFDKVLGLELGADDYIVKPFEPKEMLARVRAVLRRFSKQDDAPQNNIVIGGLCVNPEEHSVTYNGRVIDMPHKEFELLYFLASNPNKVCTRDQLLDKIWGYEYFGDTRTVDVHVKRVREKLDMGDKWGIKTIWGVGYKFDTSFE